MAVAPLNAQQPATMQDSYDLEQRMLLSIGGLATKTDLDELATKSSMKTAVQAAVAGLATKDDIERSRRLRVAAAERLRTAVALELSAWPDVGC
jgi:hypothetical protein